MNAKTPKTRKTASAYDTQQANALRKSISDLHLYPTEDLTGVFPGQPDRCREILHGLIDQLDATDLMALTHVVELLVKVPRDNAIFGYIAASVASGLARYGISIN